MFGAAYCCPGGARCLASWQALAGVACQIGSAAHAEGCVLSSCSDPAPVCMYTPQGSALHASAASCLLSTLDFWARASAGRVLHNLLGRVPSSGEYVAMRDVNTNRTMRFEIKHVATANVYYVAVGAGGGVVGWCGVVQSPREVWGFT